MPREVIMLVSSKLYVPFSFKILFGWSQTSSSIVQAFQPFFKLHTNILKSSSTVWDLNPISKKAQHCTKLKLILPRNIVVQRSHVEMLLMITMIYTRIPSMRRGHRDLHTDIKQFIFCREKEGTFDFKLQWYQKLYYLTLRNFYFLILM